MLGRFDCLLASGTRISLAMRKTEALLAFLALAPGLRHPRERLINLLWSDRAEEQARNSLRQALSSIKKSLGDVAELILHIDRKTVSLNAELVEVDALEFERLALEGDYESLASAADLYQGEFLEGMAIPDAACQEWLDGERQRFKRQYVEILFNLAETQLLSHDYAHAIKSAERLVEQDPLVESGWRLLMRSYFEYGDRNHALQAFKRCQQVLRAELEVDPEPATAELRERIADGGIEPKSAPSNRSSEAPFADPANNDHITDSLVEAGLEDTLVAGSPDEGEHDQPSIAVLPFDNMSGDPEQEHFADGITADIIDTLSKFKHLRTVSRHSTLVYRTDRPSIADIADQQGIRYILEGSVRKSGDRIRVNAELLDSRDESILWSERYDRDLDDLFAVQDDITREIALAMKVQLDDGDMARVRSKGATDIKAWELTMAAVDLQDTYVRQNIVDARKLATEATKLDPGYAYAWISLGWTYWQEYYSGCSDSLDVSIDEAEKAVKRARQIDPEYSEAYSLAGMIHLLKHEPEAAIEDCLRAVALEPGNAELQGLTAFAYVFAGDYESARVYDRNIRKLCPLRANWYFLIEGQIEVAAGNLEHAAEVYRRGLEVEPDSPLCRYFLVDLMLQMGDEAEARRYAEEIGALDKSASARGIAHTYSSDPALRRAFTERLKKFDLT